MNKDNKYLYIIFTVTGFIFLRSGYGKVTGGKFVSALAGTLGKFVSENPYPWFKSFLLDVAIPNAQLFANLTMLAEVFIGITVLVSSLYLLLKAKAEHVTYLFLAAGLATGAFLNATFWLASGWTSPSTDGLNLVMFFTQISGVAFALHSYSQSK